jgi:hypothetical protein
MASLQRDPSKTVSCSCGRNYSTNSNTTEDEQQSITQPSERRTKSFISALSNDPTTSAPLLLDASFVQIPRDKFSTNKSSSNTSCANHTMVHNSLYTQHNHGDGRNFDFIRNVNHLYQAAMTKSASHPTSLCQQCVNR